MSDRVIDETKLRRGAGFVKYEWEMLDWAWGELPLDAREAGRLVGTGNGRGEAGAVEVLLLHARALRNFYCPSEHPPPRGDDILAKDFLEDPNGWRPPILEYLLPKNEKGRKAAKAHLDQALAHFSYNRSEFPPDNWNLKRVWNELKQAHEVFLGQLPPERRAWFTP